MVNYMDWYRVGGCVRDELMGVTSKDIDYVVVGSNPQEMKEAGYVQVGADFPVFLHPVTKEEYALARTERKEYAGYCGFTTCWEGVSLRQDLERRDLTINSMAMDEEGNVIDPFGGLLDIENKVLRHTSHAFVEDPVRVLRIARFLARFGPEWKVHGATASLCSYLVNSEDFKHLTAERVFKEMEKALSEPWPEEFFKFLRQLNPEMTWFKELFDLWEIPQPEAHHPEIWTFRHTMMCLQAGVGFYATPRELFAILCHDFGKAPCWRQRGNLHGHEEEGLPYIEAFCDRLKVPKTWRELALKVCKWHQYGHKIQEVRPKKVHKFLVGVDGIKRPGLLNSFILCNYADARGRLGFEQREYLQGIYIQQCAQAARSVNCGRIATRCIAEGKTPQQIGDAIRIEQINAIRRYKNSWN
jgi:tRNA nucleotidyltransferase (CCA-adding enzyme)